GLIVWGALPNPVALAGIALIAISGVAIVLLDKRQGRNELAFTDGPGAGDKCTWPRLLRGRVALQLLGQRDELIECLAPAVVEAHVCVLLRLVFVAMDGGRRVPRARSLLRHLNDRGEQEVVGAG